MTANNDVPGLQDVGDLFPRRLIHESVGVLPGGAAPGVYYFDHDGTMRANGTSGRPDIFRLATSGSGVNPVLAGKTPMLHLDWMGMPNNNSPSISGTLKVQVASVTPGGTTQSLVQANRGTVYAETSDFWTGSMISDAVTAAYPNPGPVPAGLFVDWAGTMTASGALLITAKLYLAFV